MELSDQLSSEANLSLGTKYVRPTSELACPMPVPRPTLAHCLSPVDILHRVSLEFRKVSGDRGMAHPYPITRKALQHHHSLYRVADDLLKAVFDESLKMVSRNRMPPAPPPPELPRLAAMRLQHPQAVYSCAVAFVDDLLAECWRRVWSAEGHGVARLKAYLTPGQFTAADGLELVLACVGRWTINPHWSVEVVYAGRNLPGQPGCHSYYYTARFSVPTPAFPVAQVTADVYFTVDVFPMTPPPVHVDVWYRVETDRSRHSALADRFQQDWLNSVVKRKLDAFNLFKF